MPKAFVQQAIAIMVHYYGAAGSKFIHCGEMGKYAYHFRTTEVEVFLIM